jgi:deoxyuridine 5'-triphosphate nucleotidohydrolase
MILFKKIFYICKMTETEPIYVYPRYDKPHIRITLEEGAICPSRGTLYAAGYDLYSMEDVYIGPNSQVVKTGVHIEIPHGCVGIIKSRSSMSCKNGVYSEAGVIDSDYRHMTC